MRGRFRPIPELLELRDLQASLLAAYLRQLTVFLAPSIRSTLPEDFLEKTTTMNAAMALAWSRLTSQRAPVIPFESLGLLPRAEKLLALLEQFPAPTSADHIATVDAWSEELSMRRLYEWETFDRRT